MKLILLFFLLPLQLLAQDITGVWMGTLYNDTTKQFIKYELAISEYNGKLSGYSHTIFMIDSTENIGVKSIKIKKSEGGFLLEDDKLIYNNYTDPPAKGVKTYSELVLKENDSTLVLSGPWNTNQTKVYKKLTGNIFLQKKKQVDKTLIILKLENLGIAKSLSFSTPLSTTNDLASTTPVLRSTKKGNRVIDNKTKTISSSGNTETLEINQPGRKEKQASLIKVNADDNLISKTSLKESTPQIIKDTSKIKVTGITSPMPKKTQFEKSGETNNVDIVSGKEDNDLKKKNIKDSAATLNIGSKNKESLFKKEDVQKLNAIKTIVPQAAANIATRKIETIKSFEIKQDSLVLSLFDNGEIDGDTVSVLLNGKVIMPRQGLMARAINKTIYLTPEMGDSIVLIMYAENLGSLPPNSGLLVIHDGENIFEIRFAGDLQKNAAIILKRKRKQ